MRAFELRGSDAAAALDWLHVHVDVAGVEEHDEALVVYAHVPLPPLPFALVTVQERIVDPAAFALTGLEHDREILVAADLLVRPPWVPAPPGFVGIELVVPRGNAFGSGEHASTRAALRCLHRWWAGMPAPPRSCVDVGTGSGILALYAATRGVREIAACDIDGPSVVTARELLPDALLVHGGPAGLPVADLVIANMTGNELTAAMPEILARWTGVAALVLSGMRAHEVEPVLALVPARRAFVEVVDEFTAACCVRQPDVARGER